MYLKSIEVHGFKSFANKIKFEFNDGITGIVGPNGSGKSNVADAVRWVLGEQRAKQLRGANMQDVIFAGTESRRQLSYAYVSITLDNSDHKLAVDYDEVTVSRRVYRSGESEYLINGTPCRLKDVNELFYDTGIGKEGYSIIGQGQIDKVLSGKPEDRRELFDEAAGIVKFKRRKNISLKKLENERENLTRVNDILDEQERQLIPLRSQEAKAREYLKKKDELKRLDVNMFLLELEEIDGELSKVNKNQVNAERDYEQAVNEFEGIRKEYARLEEELGGLDASIEEARESITASKIKKERLEGDINILNEQIKAQKGTGEEFEERLKRLGERLAEKESIRSETIQKKEELDGEIESVKQAKKLIDERLRRVTDEKEKDNGIIEEGKEKIIALLNNKASVKAKLQHFDTMKGQLEIRRTKLNARLINRQNVEDELQNNLDTISGEYEEKKKEMMELRKKKDDILKARGEHKSRLKECDAELEKKKEMILRDKARLHSLKNIAETYEGYAGTVRRIMEKRDEFKGIHGVIADLISVEKEHETAIETALGGNVSNIVTEDEETAKKLVGYIKKNKFGRATFLPLTSVKGNPDNKGERALGRDGVIGMANTLVKSDPKYDGILRYLLGRVVVSENLDKALALAREFKYTLHIVTLQGEYLSPGGSISGGAFKNNANLLGRNRQIEEIERSIAGKEADIKEINSRMDKLALARELLGDDLNEVEKEMHEKALELNTLKHNKDGAQERKAAADAEFEAIKKENASILSELDKLNSDVERINEEESRDIELQKEIEEQNKLLMEKVDELAKSEEEINAELSRITLDIASLEQKCEFENQNIVRIDGEINELTNDRKRLESAKEGTGKDIEAKEKRITEIKDELDGTEKYEGELAKKLESDIKTREQMNSLHKDFFNKRDDVQNRISSLDKEIFRLKDRLEKLNSRREYRINYMWEEYELTSHTAAELRDESVSDISGLKSDISNLKEDIKNLGQVNVNAIEDYRELSQRYEFLMNQRNDLQDSEAALINIIDELDAGMKKQFSEKFAIICKEFDSAFKQLFGGGKGTLELVEDDDILESGIQITAQPPGKKLQNMMQLSGGEKALTAISLLFAIQNMKPSPFCLLDEIEAALDDSNVGRFADYLHKLTKNTQFIIITHRRGTMAAADRLYGITMQEKGVSTLVSVNLIEEDLDE